VDSDAVGSSAVVTQTSSADKLTKTDQRAVVTSGAGGAVNVAVQTAADVGGAATARHRAPDIHWTTNYSYESRTVADSARHSATSHVRTFHSDTVFILSHPRPQRGVPSIVMSMSVCLSLSAPDCSAPHISENARPNVTKFLLLVACGHGSALLRRRWDTLCTSVLWMTLYFHTMGPGASCRPVRNSGNCCIDYSPVLINDKGQRVHILGCTPRAKSVAYNFLVLIGVVDFI